MKKNTIPILLLVMILVFPYQTSVVYANGTYGDFNYTLSGGYATITGYTGSGGAIIIPDKVIEGGTDYTVITIGDSAFRYNTEITSVTIPEGILNIGVYAFDECSGISSPIVMPNSLRVINYGAFMECTNLPSVVLNAGLKIIGEWAFARCRFTSEVIIPDLVPEIKKYTFYDCKLPAITLGKGVTSIGEEALSGAWWLERITVSSENSQYKDIDGVLFNKSGTILIKFPQGKSGAYTVPDGVETFGKDSFFCNKVPSITIPSSVNNVDYLIYGSHVYYIVDSGNTSFDSQDGVLYNEGFTTLLSYGNADKNLVIPASVSKIGERAFGSSSLESITIPGTVKVIGESAFHSNMFKSVTIEEGVETIEDSAFDSDHGFTEIIIPSSVNYMGEGVFSLCTDLKSVTYKDGLKNIGAGTFHYCPLLESVILPHSLETIQDAAFIYCYGLKTIKIPENVTTIGADVFHDCTSLTDVIFYGEKPTTFGANVFLGTPSGLTAYYHIKHSSSWSGFTLCPTKAFCTLTYDLLDGSTPIGTFTVLDNSGLLPVPVVPSREGYTFEGWYKEAALINTFDFDNEPVNDDLTLYAKWSLNDEAIQIAGSSDGSIISMAEGNTLINDSLNSWGVHLTEGTVKGAKGDDLTNYLEVEGLPAGLTWSAKNSGLNNIEITVSGTALSPVNSQTNITVTVKGGAVVENGAINSNPISDFFLLPYASDEDISGDFTDTNFKNAIWVWLGNSGTPGSFTKHDLIDRVPEKDYLLDVSRFFKPESLKIKSLNGFEHFQGTGLKKFYCYDNPLGSLPELPDTLEVLRCQSNRLLNLPILPESMKEILCSSNNGLTITELPRKLEILDCSYCDLLTIPELPISLIDLDCSANRLASIPQLPDGLKYLMCNYNSNAAFTDYFLPDIPDLPDGLLRFAMEGNYMTQLPELPSSLEILNCPYNRLTSIPDLPDSLIQLWVDYNPIEELPSLPASLEILACEYTNLTSLPDLPEGLKQLQCRWNYLDVFSDPLQSMISLCTAPTKELTPQYRVTYSGNSRALQFGDTSQLIASDFLHQQSSNGTEWANTTTLITINDFIFSSSDDTVATVNSDGLISTVGAGNCEIFADYKGISSKLTRALIPVQVSSSALTVTGTAMDATTILKIDNQELSLDNTWKIKVTSGTVKGLEGGDLTDSVILNGLPDGLTYTATKSGTNCISITLSGKANTALTSDAVVSAVIKGNAVTEVGAQDSEALSLDLWYIGSGTTFVITNEGGLIDKLISAGYGDYCLYDVLEVLKPQSDCVISNRFMEILKSCPTDSEIFDEEAAIHNFAGLNNPICINLDGTLRIQPIFAEDYFDREGYFTKYSTQIGVGKELFTYATTDVHFINAGERGNNNIYMAFAIAWSANLPTVITNTVSANDVTTVTANLSGSVASDNGLPITERGFVYSTTVNPTTSTGTKQQSGSGIGTFTINLSGLTAGTTYHVRAYACSEAGTAYGQDRSFTTNVISNAVVPESNQNSDNNIVPDTPVSLPDEQVPLGSILFTDIAGHWAEEEIYDLVSKGIIKGYDDNTFRPDSTITRAEFADMLVKAFNLEPMNDKTFDDITGHWAQDSIETAASYGIIKGYNETNFGPDDVIQREQMAAMVTRARKKIASSEAASIFIDADTISGWAKQDVDAVVEELWMIGYIDNTFRPHGYATRAEAVRVIYNIMN